MISICMIVKNEEAILEKCLEKLKMLNYEIIIVDTGSIDNSKSIAYKYTDKVFDHKWNCDFSDARNFAIEKATNDFIMMIDSDEVISEYDKNILEELCEKNKKSIGRISIINKFSKNNLISESKDKVGRIFSKKYYKYEGKIHEQLVSINNSEVSYYNVPIQAIHYGYRQDEIKRKNKIERNIGMLKQEIMAKGESPYILYQLGKSYYMDENYEDALKNFYKVLEYDLDTKLEYVVDLIECYGYCFLNLGKYNEALAILSVYDEFSTSSDFIFLIALIYMNNSMFDKAIEEFKKVTKMKNANVLGVNSFLSNYNIGVIYECLGSYIMALKYYEKCEGYELALRRIEDIKNINKDLVRE